MRPWHPRDAATPPPPAPATEASRELRDRELREFRESRDRERQEFRDAAAPRSRSPARHQPGMCPAPKPFPGHSLPALLHHSRFSMKLKPSPSAAPRHTRDVPSRTRIAPKANKPRLQQVSPVSIQADWGCQRPRDSAPAIFNLGNAKGWDEKRFLKAPQLTTPHVN